MLFLAIIFTLVTITTSGKGTVGTTLFHSKSLPSDCWSDDEIALLKARKIFEEIIPPQISPEKVDVKYIKNLLAYFRRALKSIEKEDNAHNVLLLKEALADTIGGHLRRNILPTVRFAYYAGYIPFRHARNLQDFYESITDTLNTKGKGWKQAALGPEWSNLTVLKVVIDNSFFEPCSTLIMERDKHQCIHLPKPKTDNFQEPNTLLLPFKDNQKGLIPLRSPRSENVVVNYYITAARCILDKATNSCRHSDFINFNNELWHWMKREVAPRLTDEKLYAAYGGVLRVAAAVQSYGKGLSRRNLFDAEKHDKKWKIWKRFSNEEDKNRRPCFFRFQSYNFDLLLVLLGTLFMYTILVIANALCTRCKCYDYLQNYYNSCAYQNFVNAQRTSFYQHQPPQQAQPQPQPQPQPPPCEFICRGCLRPISMCTCRPVKSKWGRLLATSRPSVIAYSTVESNFPAMLPAPASPVSRSDRGASKGSVKTRVYDLNEGREKEMEVVLQASEYDSDSDSSVSGEATLVVEPPVPGPPPRQSRAGRGSGTTRTSVCTSHTRSWALDDSCSSSGSSSSARSSSPRWRTDISYSNRN